MLGFLWRILLSNSIVMITLLCCTNAYGQQAPAAGDDQLGSHAKHVIGSRPGYGSREWTSVELGLSCGLLIFALIVLGLLTFLILKGAAKWSPPSIIRAFGLVLLVTGALLLITAGYAVEQISPAMGFLGAVSGYLLGSTESSKRPGNPDNSA
jgi:hypothetical protein